MKRYLIPIFFVLYFLSLGPAAHASVTLVQATSTFTTSTSLTAAFGSSTTANNLLIAYAGAYCQANTLTISDTGGNTWVSATSGISIAGTGTSTLWAAIAKGGADTVHVSSTCGGAGFDMDIAEFSATNGWISAAADETQATSGTAFPVMNTGAAATTTNANDLLIGAFYDTVGSNNLTAGGNGKGGSYTKAVGTINTADAESSILEYMEVTSTAAYVATSTGAASGDDWTATLAAFKEKSLAPAVGFAWGNKMSWVNFATANAPMVVSSSKLTGYAWSQNFGWINLAPSGSGVANDGLGNLQGYAWGQNVGWINFSGVTINSSTGVFSGTASGTVAGSLSFGCSVCDVVTTWRPSTSSAVTVSNTTLNGASSIVLTPNATTSVSISTTITDTNGCSAITAGTTTVLLYRSGVSSSTCLGAPNNRNCYVANAFAATSTCSSNSMNATATFGVYYFADATDASSSFASQNWIATVNFRDSSAATNTQDATGQELNTLLAINVTTSTINYGTVNANANTGSLNRTTTVQDAGNASTTLQISGTALVKGANVITTSSQHYATTSFTFGGSEQVVNSSPTTVSGFLLSAPTSTAGASSSIFWGLAVPNQLPTGTYSGTVTFTSIFSQ